MREALRSLLARLLTARLPDHQDLERRLEHHDQLISSLERDQGAIAARLRLLEMQANLRRGQHS